MLHSISNTLKTSCIRKMWQLVYVQWFPSTIYLKSIDSGVERIDNITVLYSLLIEVEIGLPISKVSFRLHLFKKWRLLIISLVNVIVLINYNMRTFLIIPFTKLVFSLINIHYKRIKLYNKLPLESKSKNIKKALVLFKYW